MVVLADIERARERIHEQIYLSPLARSETISRMSGNEVFFKLENLQMTGSFKERGALNRLLTLAPEEAGRGVIAASAGNHGMAVAFHSRRLKIAATIVMPVTAPLIKVTRVRQYGAEGLLCGSDYSRNWSLCSEETCMLSKVINSPSPKSITTSLPTFWACARTEAKSSAPSTLPA